MTSGQPVMITEETFVSLIGTIVPHMSTLFWVCLLALVGTVAFVSLRSFIEKLAAWSSIRFFDRYLNTGVCIDYKGFFGTIKKIAPTYVLIEKAHRSSKVRVFRRVPILEFGKWHIDFYEQRCSSIECECMREEDDD